jgi:hypothetical protein
MSDARGDVSGSDEGLPAHASPADIVAGEAAHEPPPADSAATIPASAGPPFTTPLDTGYTAGGVPTFDMVRDKIETRYGKAIGASELSSETPEGVAVEEQYEARQRAAAERLAQIKKSMHPDESTQS